MLCNIQPDFGFWNHGHLWTPFCAPHFEPHATCLYHSFLYLSYLYFLFYLQSFKFVVSFSSTIFSCFTSDIILRYICDHMGNILAIKYFAADTLFMVTLCFALGNGTPLRYSCLENPMDGGAWWAAVHGVAKSWTWLRDFTLTFHFPALEKEMATHSSVLAWRVPGMGEPGGLPSVGWHRVGHDWGDLAAAAQGVERSKKLIPRCIWGRIFITTLLAFICELICAKWIKIKFKKHKQYLVIEDMIIQHSSKHTTERLNWTDSCR